MHPHFPKAIAGGGTVLLLLLLVFRNVVPAKWKTPITTLIGVLGGAVPSIAAGVEPLDALNHVLVGGMAGALVGQLAPGPKR